MDPMARTYGTLGPSENFLNWTSGRPVMEILEEERRITHRTSPANDNGCAGWAVMRDHSPDDLNAWLDGTGPSPDQGGPFGLRPV